MKWALVFLTCRVMWSSIRSWNGNIRRGKKNMKRAQMELRSQCRVFFRPANDERKSMQLHRSIYVHKQKCLSLDKKYCHLYGFACSTKLLNLCACVPIQIAQDRRRQENAGKQMNRSEFYNIYPSSMRSNAQVHSDWNTIVVPQFLTTKTRWTKLEIILCWVLGT